MKKTFIKNLVVVLLSGIALMLGVQIVMAQGTAAASESAPTELFQPLVSKGGTSKVNLIQNLPKGDWQDIIGSIIKLVLGITGSLAFISFTYGGIMMVTAQGDEAKYKKGRSVIFWSLLALIVIAISYSIVVGISNLKFFNT